jgi:molybdopterin biosynthesis enzyme
MELGKGRVMTRSASCDRAALTPLETALAALLDDLAPIAPTPVAVVEAGGLVAADMPPIETPVPPTNIAEIDGWAFRASDLAGASSYATLAMTGAPAWVEAGAPLPTGCDCVLEPAFVEQAGPAIAILGEAALGESASRVGEDAAVGGLVVTPGRVMTALDLCWRAARGWTGSRCAAQKCASSTSPPAPS